MSVYLCAYMYMLRVYECTCTCTCTCTSLSSKTNVILNIHACTLHLTIFSCRCACNGHDIDGCDRHTGICTCQNNTFSQMCNDRPCNVRQQVSAYMSTSDIGPLHFYTPLLKAAQNSATVALKLSVNL